MNDVTRRDVVKLVVAGAAVTAVGASARADDKPAALAAQKWDCIENKSGKTILLTLASGHAGGPGVVMANNQKYPFKVRNTTAKMAYVAYENGTDKLVKLEEFTVVPQNYPPSNCLVIPATTAAAARAAHPAPAATTPAGEVPAAPEAY